MLAEATGGTVIGNYSQIDDALDHLSRYVNGSQVQVISRIAPDTDVSSRVFTFHIRLDFAGPPSALVVMVEDVLTGAWGSARVGAGEMNTE